MIPVKLTVSNFTSYGAEPQELDFTKFHMAAISGHNGAGKSSLLDSVTWCLWGTSRLGDNSDSLIRLGQVSMYVEFSFLLDENTYLVKRQRSNKGSGSTALEFWSGSHNLTEGTIKATQQKIIDTLHLSYETFTNSAFLRQGHADEFTTKGATDRKRILADILGLAHYDLLEEKAKEKSKDLQAHLQRLDYQLMEIEAELSQKDEREKKLSDVEKEAQLAEDELKTVELEIKLVESERETLSVKQQTLLEKQKQVEMVQKEINEITIQISVKEKAIQEYQAILGQRKEIEENFLNLENLREEKKILDSKRSELIKVKDEWAELLKTVRERDEKRNKAISDLQIEIKELETKNQKCQIEIDHLTTHKDSCPTCNQTIGEAKNKEIIAKNQGTISANKASTDQLNTKVKKYQEFQFEEQLKADEKEQVVKAIEQETKNYPEVSQKLFALEKYNELYSKLQQAETAVSSQDEIIADLKKISETKQNQIKDNATDLEQLKLLEEQLQVIRKQIEAKIQVKQEISQKAGALRSQVGAAKQLMERATQMVKVQEERKVEQSTIKKDKEFYDELALAFGKKGIQAMIIETAIPEIEEETNRLLDKLTEGRMRVALVTQKETKTKVAGTKEKGIVETLDIIISDEMGERPYEAYSGGEQFRVNFAIRLSLSKLLTNRAGSKLQFLVIDEGFGTQDSEGRSRIVEALDAIKDDFEKVLIITHLDELKDEFSSRIEVLKGSTGSRFELVT